MAKFLIKKKIKKDAGIAWSHDKKKKKKIVKKKIKKDGDMAENNSDGDQEMENDV